MNHVPTFDRVLEPTGSAVPVILLRKVQRVFGSEPPVVALRDIDLTVQSGEWISILGPSGSGKSTLLNVIGLLDRHDGGDYLFEGLDVSELDELARAGLRGQRVGFVFQAFHLLPQRSVLENVMLAELYAGIPRKGRADRARAALDRVGMAKRAGFLPTRLSGGERQRVAIARAIVREPSLLLCDEPTGNLDTENAESLLQLFTGLSKEGITLLVITHDEEVAWRAQRVVRMVDGSLGATTRPASFPVVAAAGNGRLS